MIKSTQFNDAITSSIEDEDSFDMPDQKTKDIPVDFGDDENDSVPVDFQSEDVANAFASKPTKDNRHSETIDSNSSTDKIRDDIRSYEESKVSKMEYKDFLKISEFVMKLIDTSISSALNWIAKDTSSSAYSIEAESRKMLSEQLALILTKYQQKFSIEFLFFMGLIVIYTPPTIAAIKMKNTKKSVKAHNDNMAREREKQPSEAFYRYNKEEYRPEPEVKKQEEVLETLEVPIKKRNRGKQPKAF